MSCCDDCAKTGGTCADQKWTVGSALANVVTGGQARVGQDPPVGATPEAVAWGEEQFKQGVTYGWIGGSALIIALWGGLYLMRGR